MTHKILILTLLFVSISYAQDSIKTQVVTPKIVTKLMLGEEFERQNISIRFIDVENDSRCPKNVNCVRAGEAKVVYEVFMDGTFVKRCIVEITPTTYLSNALPKLYGSEDFTITAYNLMPYPEYRSNIEKGDYYLQLFIAY